MSEIELLYKNAGIENYQLENFCGLVPKGYTTIDDEERKGYVKVVRDFTPEKQLELIEFYIKSVWWLNLACFKCSNLPFDEELAKLTNHLWEDMTISQQEQIRSILNGK